MKEHFSNDEFMEAGREACRAAAAGGAGQSEAWLQRERSITLSVENNRLRSCEARDDQGFCVRALTRGAVGYARGMGLDAAALAAAGRDAASQSAAAEPDPGFVSLPQPSGYSEASGLFDPAIEALTPSGVAPWAAEFIDAALRACPDAVIKADISVTTGTCAVVNSLGVEAVESYTFADTGIFVIVRKSGDVGSYFDFSRARRLSDLRPHADLAKNATERALSFLGAGKAPTGEMPVVLGPLAAYFFLREILGAADAESVQRGRSFLAGKRGAKIAPEFIAIEEDPLFEAGVSSGPFDAEGTPKVKRALVQDGALTCYLHNSTTAGRAGEPLTGHAERNGYLSGVAAGISNMSIKPGTQTEAELISTIKNGLYVASGSLAPNAVSGAVSGTVDYGYAIENGRIASPVANTMLGGHALEILSNISAVSSDFRSEPGNVMPSLLIGRVAVAGG